jgi:hypothetical protein
LDHKKFKQGTPEEEARRADVNAKLKAASEAIDRTRVEAWRPLSVMRLLASKEVLRAADAYDRALAASNPRREKVTPVPLEMSHRRDLIDGFVAAARVDLGRVAVERQTLISADEPKNESAPDDDSAPPIGQTT